MSDQTTSRRSLLAGGVVGSALGGLILDPGAADAAITVPTGGSVAFFLDLDGIPGESTDAQFPNTFEILDYAFGATTSVARPIRANTRMVSQVLSISHQR